MACVSGTMHACGMKSAAWGSFYGIIHSKMDTMSCRLLAPIHISRLSTHMHAQIDLLSIRGGACCADHEAWAVDLGLFVPAEAH